MTLYNNLKISKYNKANFCPFSYIFEGPSVLAVNDARLAGLGTNELLELAENIRVFVVELSEPPASANKQHSA